MKIRRSGNSAIITVPRELEQYGFTEGREVTIVPLGDGRAMLVANDQIAAILGLMADEIIEKRRSTLDRLAEYDAEQ